MKFDRAFKKKKKKKSNLHQYKYADMNIMKNIIIKSVGGNNIP